MRLDSSEVVIIGGGCIGTSAAYHLCKAGVSDVVLVEKDFLASGATGQCGGGMRHQWSTRGNIILAKHSIAAFEVFENQTGQDIDFVQGGYLLTAYDEERAAELKEDIALQNSCGVGTRFVTPVEVSKIAPILKVEGMLGAAYGPKDGKANPFLVVKGYAERAKEMGARIYTRTTVTGLRTDGNRIKAVLTDRGAISANWVINASGGHAAKIAALCGEKVPIRPYRHQILVTEPVERCHDPMVIDLHHNIYFLQEKHGAFLAGQTDGGELSGFNIREGWKFAVEVSGKIVGLAPKLKNLQIVRQWAGLYAMTPDRQPIIGRFSKYENFLIAAGYSGHGFMLAPASGKIMSEIIADGDALTVDIDEYSVERFKSGKFTVEKNVV